MLSVVYLTSPCLPGRVVKARIPPSGIHRGAEAGGPPTRGGASPPPAPQAVASRKSNRRVSISTTTSAREARVPSVLGGTSLTQPPSTFSCYFCILPRRGQ